MEIIHEEDKIASIGASVLTVGSYDGLHRGHQKLLTTVVEHADLFKLVSVCVTFDPHPRSVLNTEIEKKNLIMSLNQKLAIIDSLGIDYVYIIKFSKKISKLSAEDFMTKIIIPNFNPQKIISGYNHHFGKNREGSPSFLKSFGAENGIDVIFLKPVFDNKTEISSTKIRKFLRDGFIQKANYALGTYFSIYGEVINGAGRGKSLSFPTANINPNEKKQLLPKKGVYLVRGRINGLNAFGMCNIGVRPTFGESKLVMEIHFFHNNVMNLYGKKVRLEFLERIRDEKKFHSSKDLIKQLIIDKQICLEISNKYK